MELVDAQARVEGMIAAGEPFEAVEDFVEGELLPGTQKAALWLLAWSAQDRRTQRRVAREALAMVG